MVSVNFRLIMDSTTLVYLPVLLLKRKKVIVVFKIIGNINPLTSLYKNNINNHTGIFNAIAKSETIRWAGTSATQV